jgi:hypothetical protein
MTVSLWKTEEINQNLNHQKFGQQFAELGKEELKN